MDGEVGDAITNDILKPSSELRMADNDDREFQKGLILERTPEILVHSHAVTEERVNKMLARAEYFKYITSPSKHNFRKTVVITVLVFKFDTKFEYIHSVWNVYLGGFDPETSSSSDSSCPTLHLHGYRDRVFKYVRKL